MRDVFFLPMAHTPPEVITTSVCPQPIGGFMVRSLRSGLKSICVFALLSLATAAPPPLAARPAASTWQLIDPPPSGGVSSQSVSGEAKTVYVIDGQAGVAASPLPQEFKDHLGPRTRGTASRPSGDANTPYVIDGQAGVAASPLPQEFKDQLVPPTSGTVSTSSVPDEDVYIAGEEIVDGILASEAAGEPT